MEAPDPTALAWAAGLMEGEGSFMVGVQRRSALDGRPMYAGRVRCVMTDRDVIERLRAVFGVGTVAGFENNGLGTQRLYRWDVTRRADVLAVCAALGPLMGLRRRGQIARVVQTLADNPPRSAAEWRSAALRERSACGAPS